MAVNAPVSSDVIKYGDSLTEQSIEELLPSAQKTALLFNLSYLCMGNFPNLERLIRSKATDSQQLFSSSANLLLQCASTSDNMVKTLIPMLKATIEKNKPVIAVKYLGKARRWIEDIIQKVKETVKNYRDLDKAVGSTASDVILTQKNTETKKIKTNKEAETLNGELNKLKERAETIKKELQKIESEIDQEQSKLEKTVRGIASRNKKFGIAAAVVPVIGWIVDSCQKLINEPDDTAAIEVSKNKLKQLGKEKRIKSEQEWNLEVEAMHLRMSLSKVNQSLGSIPNPDELNEVQKCLTRIQQILLRLGEFWEGVGVMLDNLQGKTFAGEDMIEDLDVFKNEFLSSLDVAQKAWGNFGALTLKVRGTFSIQTKDAYKFLEVNPSSLTKEEWQKQYNHVQEQLKALHAPQTPAIEEVSSETPEENNEVE